MRDVLGDTGGSTQFGSVYRLFFYGCFLVIEFPEKENKNSKVFQFSGQIPLVGMRPPNVPLLAMTLLSAWLLVDKYSSSPRSVPPIPGAHSTCTADARAPVRPAPAAQLLTHLRRQRFGDDGRILSDLVPDIVRPRSPSSLTYTPGW